MVNSKDCDSLPQYSLPAPTMKGKYINREYAAKINYDPVEIAKILRTEVNSLTVLSHRVDNAMGEILFLGARWDGKNLSH